MARSRRRRSRAKSSLPQIVLGALLIAAAAVVVGFFVYLKITTPIPPKVGADGCPIDGAAAVTVVLVDTSDALPQIGREQLVSQLSDMADTSPKYGRFEVRLLKPGIVTGNYEFSQCNPGDGSDIDPKIGNPDLAKKKWQEFKGSLNAALSKELRDEPSDNSPIMQAVQAIAVERFSSAQADKVPKSLVIVSDMVENSPDYSQYRGDLSFARFKKSAAYRKYRTDLHGANVSIFYVQRQRPAVDSVAHIGFWHEWIVDNNGQFDSAKTLQGVN